MTPSLASRRAALPLSLLALWLPSLAASQEPAPQDLPPQPPEVREPETQPEVAAREPAAPARRPATPWVRTAHDAAQGSVVTVRCGWHRGAGFVFGAGDQVATSGAVDHCTRGIEVVLPDGTVLPVTRGRVAGGVALLRLPRDSGLRPLASRPEAVRVGDPIAVVHRAGGRDGRVVITAGTASAEPGETLHVQLAAEAPRGAPVVDGRGRVVGVVSPRHRMDDDPPRVVPVGRLDELGGEGAEETLGRAVTFGIGPFAALVRDEDPADGDRNPTLAGFGGALAATLHDRLTLVGAFSILGDTSDLFDDGLVERSARRYQGELRLGWRFLPWQRWPLYVVPSLGASAKWTTWTDRRLQVQLEDPACDLSAGSACALDTTVVETEDDRFAITPYAHLALRLGFLELGYTLSLAVDGPGTLVHRFLLGAWMGT